MKQTRHNHIAIFTFIGMLIIILDSNTALQGTLDGIEICLRTVIPSLLPMMILSTLFINSMLGIQTQLLAPLQTFCGIPAGAESILLTGLLGGYPLGACAVARAYKSNQIDRQTANRMLAFCNNAGPAFIFGIGSVLFKDPVSAWILWIIHIFSAILTAAILPGKSKIRIKSEKNTQIRLPDAIKITITTLSSVCGWVILFKVILSFFEKWFLWLFTQRFQILIYGFFELTNGFVALLSFSNYSICFIMASVFLAFGGFCVCMQTYSEIHNLDFKYYLFGKVIQVFFSFQLSVIHLLINGYSTEKSSSLIILALISVLLLPILLGIFKKTVDFSINRIYNRINRIVTG